jgi:hypothetical protein
MTGGIHNLYFSPIILMMKKAKEDEVGGTQGTEQEHLESLGKKTRREEPTRKTKE